jgi:hypothetical protein
MNAVPRALVLVVVVASLLAVPGHARSAGADVSPRPVSGPRANEVRLFLPITLARAGDPPAPFILGGSTGVMVSDGELAYAMVGPRLTTATVVNFPRTLGFSGPLDGLPSAMALAGDLVLMAMPRTASETDVRHDAPGGLRVIDVHDVGNPRWRGSYRFSDASGCYDVVARLPFAYAACWWGGLKTFDLSNPAQPTLAAASSLDAAGFALELDGTHVYLGATKDAADAAQLVVFDLATDPRQPRRVGEVALPAPAGSTYSLRDGPPLMGRHGHHVYIAPRVAGGVGWPQRFFVVDVADPAAPRVVRTVDLASELLALEVIGNTLVTLSPYPSDLLPLAAPAETVLSTWSLVRPDQPEQRGQLRLTGFSQHLAPAGTVALVDQGTRIARVAVTDPAHPQSAGSTLVSEMTAPYALTATDGALYTANTGDGVRIWDVRAPGRPRLTAELALDLRAVGTSADQVVVSDGLLFVNHWDMGDRVLMVDVRKTPQIRKAGEVAVPDGLRRMAAVDHTLYLAEGEYNRPSATSPVTGALRVLDVTDPAAPRELERLPGRTTSVGASADRVVAWRECGPDMCLVIYARQPDGRLEPLGEDHPQPPPSDDVRYIALDGDTVFADWWRYDITDPALPVRSIGVNAGECAVCTNIAGLDVAGDLVVYRIGSTLRSAPVSVPPPPDGSIATRYRLPGGTVGAGPVATDGQSIFAAYHTLWRLDPAPVFGEDWPKW